MNALPANGDPTAPTIDSRNPWLGLASFTEETREYFYGRDDEVAELARRVQRKLLTVLFGQSGLGKTSILRAGLVPRLRSQGYCPIYVRIDYSRDAPEPAEQIKQAIQRTAKRSGQWTQVGVAVAGETLWEYLHHRDDVLRDESGATLIPLLIFDQFEEIFTLAQSDEFGRARAARFISDLADLVENRPPREVEARLESDDAAAEHFDFARSDYRVLISLREDYLAPLEGLKGSMPSVTQNRLRLAPMNGQQALAAVLKPGRGLVSQEVAEAIVRFVAGGAELANAEVEPSLLSLICRELNDTRLAQGRSEISLDLLAGSHETILANFYERSLADQPPAVRRIIEDELLTASGYRENIAEERLQSSFAAVGAAPEVLPLLVNRRLLRIEERLDVRRVELTHDVLCGVVKRSRDLRHEREARDEAERLLNEQRERARAARQALVRARQVAAVCIVLMVGAVAAAGYAYLSSRRARAAEHQAEQARAAADEARVMTEQARGQAEQLLGYLTADFSRELEGFGRLDIVAELTRREMDYFKALPPALQGGDTTRNGALAMVYYARAMRGLGKIDKGAAAATQAAELLTRLQSEGDRSEPTTIALGLALLANAMVLDNSRSPEALPTAAKAAENVRPIATAPNASLDARRAYVEILDRLGFLQLRAYKLEDAEATLRLAMTTADAAGAHDPTNADFAAEYANCAAWQIEALTALGRNDEARRVAADGGALADRLLERRPGYLLALRARQLIASGAGEVDMDDMRNRDALVNLSRGVAVSRMLAKLDPDNTIIANNLAVDIRELSDAQWSQGLLHESIATMAPSFATYRIAERGGPGFVLDGMFPRNVLISRLADVGDAAATRPLLADNEKALEALRKVVPAGSPTLSLGECSLGIGHVYLSLFAGDPTRARTVAEDCAGKLRALSPKGADEGFRRNIALFYTGYLIAMAELAQRDYAAVEATTSEALEVRARWPMKATSDRRDQSFVLAMRGIALGLRGDRAGAARVIGPVLKFERELAARNRDDAWQHVELALALVGAAVADPAQHDALLSEANALLAALPSQMQTIRTVAFVRGQIDAARRATA